MVHQCTTNNHVGIAELVTGIAKDVQKIAVAAFWTFSLMVKSYIKHFQLVVFCYIKTYFI